MTAIIARDAMEPQGRYGILSLTPQAPEDQMFGLSAAYRSDPHPKKVDLGAGAHRSNEARPWLLPFVTTAKQKLLQIPDLNHEYLTIAGLQEYLDASQNLIFGDECAAIKERRVASVQTISGTGALHLGSLFLARFFPNCDAKKVYVSTPPYANHLPIVNHVSLKIELYPYYSKSSKGIEFERMTKTLESIPDHSIVLLHACAHNPTGVDPTREQWKGIAAIMKAKQQLPFFDSAYQGFAFGNMDADAWAIRYFVKQDFDTILVAQSYAKNMGLYGERIGCLHVVTPSSNLSSRIHSQLKKLQRVDISTPPAYGARIVSLILNDKKLFIQWKQDLRTMSGRIIEMRRELQRRLEANGTPGTWDHITNQKGMFCFSGLDEEQVQFTRRRYHIYTTPNGRFSISGLNSDSLDYVAAAIKAAIISAKL